MQKSIYLFGTTLISLIIISCAGGWTEAQIAQFMADCKDQGGTEAICKCTVDQAKEKYDYEELRAATQAEERSRTDGQNEMIKDLQTMANSCQNGGGGGTTGGSTWSESEKAGYIQECVTSGNTQAACTCFINAVAAQYTKAQLEKPIRSVDSNPDRVGAKLWRNEPQLA